MKQTSFLGSDLLEIMVPARKVAFVYEDNSLEHALLILTQTGYSAIPVLDQHSRIRGIINTTLVVKAMITTAGYDVDKLTTAKISEVMLRDIPRVTDTQGMLKAVKLSINWPFLCVEDAEGKFIGIVTRQNILGTLYQHVSSESYSHN